jgi:hypothetical protein
MVTAERGEPLERQTAAVTTMSARQNTYIRQFAIGQGTDTVVSLLLHESLHGAGLPEGPFSMYEPLFHAFEAEAGFPMMMGGADIVSIRQVRRGDYGVDVTFVYNLRQVSRDEPLPGGLEIQVVSQETGAVVYDEQPDGSRRPARSSIPSRAGRGRWVWRARNPGWATWSVRIVSTQESSLLGSRSFDTNPRCVLGVSSRHCE